jgi:acetyl-CoA synthetase
MICGSRPRIAVKAPATIARFWGEHGKRLDWIKPYTKVKNTSFAHDNVDIRWFEDGTLNVAANCIDRHLATRGDQTAIIFEPDDPKEAAQHITYKQLHAEVCRFANVLKELGVGARATGSSSTCR